MIFQIKNKYFFLNKKNDYFLTNMEKIVTRIESIKSNFNADNFM